MKREITIREKYAPAMEITDPMEAARYFEACVEHSMIYFGKSRKEAEKLERINLGYYAGYYDHKTRQRVERLFLCEHPVFGPAGEVEPSLTEIFQLGLKMGRHKGGASA